MKYELGVEVNEEMQMSSTMQFTERVSSCPLCKAERAREYARAVEYRKGSPGPLPPIIYKICCHCGLVFQSPRPSQAELNAFYTAEYRLLYNGDEKPIESNLVEQHQRGAHLAEVVATRISAVASYLDIGCSAGVLLQEFHKKFGIPNPCGVELSDAHRAVAAEQGFDVFASLDELARTRENKQVPEKFELISLSHVLEHISDPVGYLKEVRQTWLPDHGHLLIEVPNLFGHSSFEVAHLFAFDSKTLRETLEQAGFEVILVKLHSLPRGGKGLRYITMLAQPMRQAPPPVAAAKWRFSHLRRRQGMSGHRWPLFFVAETTRAMGIKRKAKSKAGSA